MKSIIKDMEKVITEVKWQIRGLSRVILMDIDRAKDIAKALQEFQKTYNIPDEKIPSLLDKFYKLLRINNIIVSNPYHTDVYGYPDLMPFEEYYLYFYKKEVEDENR